MVLNHTTPVSNITKKKDIFCGPKYRRGSNRGVGQSEESVLFLACCDAED